MPAAIGGSFDEGSTVVRRNVFRGKVVSAWPCRLVYDTGAELAWACLPGVEVLAQTTYIEGLRTGDESLRDRTLSELAAGDWTLGTSIIRHSTILGFQLPDTYFSVLVFFRENGEPRMWYVNFERPFRRTAIGVDTCDLMVDLVIEPDLTYRWKDEDEYQQGRRLGIVDDTDHAEVEKARDQALAMLERRTGPFEARWLSWRRDLDWPIPTLPANAASLPPMDTP